MLRAGPELLDEALETAELQIYVSTVGLGELSAELEARALGSGLLACARRARLIGSDVLSRGGMLEDALRIQLEVLTDAELDDDASSCARAQCLLASTYHRLAEVGQAQISAEAGVRMLSADAPPSWPAEHMMVLALFTSYRRHGPIDLTTFEEALRLAGESRLPLLRIAVLNNFAYVALTANDERAKERAASLCEEMHELVEEHLPQRCPSTWLDTLALGLMNSGRLAEASEMIGRGIEMGSRGQVEPSALAVCLLRDAEIRLANGEHDAARERALEARELALDAGALETAALSLKTIAGLAAATGDFETAYRLVCRFQAEWDAFQTERGEMHAATLQAIYGVQVERQRRLAVEQLADTDALTGLANRRYLSRRLKELKGHPKALALLDVDHFKQINDRYSHDVGDRVLQTLAQTLTEGERSSDQDARFTARIGGEEFVAAFLEARPDAVLARCEALRAAVETTDWGEIADGLRVTVSIGVALDHTGMAERSELLRRADKQLYEAKRQGRNRVIAEQPVR